MQNAGKVKVVRLAIAPALVSGPDGSGNRFFSLFHEIARVLVVDELSRQPKLGFLSKLFIRFEGEYE
jgi:hypothetical protein